MSHPGDEELEPDWSQVPFPDEAHEGTGAVVVQQRPARWVSDPDPSKPPHSVDAERELLGAVLVGSCEFELRDGNEERMAKLGRDAVDALRSIGADAFYLQRHQIIARAMLQLIEQGSVIDPLLISEQVKANGQWELLGGWRPISELLERVGSVVNASHYAKRVQALAIDRALQAEYASAGAHVLDGDSDARTKHLATIANLEGQRAAIDAPKDSMTSKVSAWRDRVENPRQRRTIPTGIRQLDEPLGGGLGRGWLVTILAPPKQRKTALAVNNFQAHSLAMGHAGLYVGEGHEDELIERFMARESGVPLRAQHKGDLTSMQWGAASNAQDRVAKWRWRALPMMSADKIASAARAFKAEQGDIDTLVVDFAQIVPNDIDDVVASISHTTRTLKLLAPELDCVIMLLSQPVNTDARNQTELNLYSGKGSGSLASDCDLCLIPTGDLLPSGVPKSNRAGLSAPGFRHGEPFKLDLGTLTFNGARMCFEG